MIPTPTLAANWPDSYRNFACVARARAATTPDAVAFTFLDYATEVPQEQMFDCAALDRRARQVAALLQSRVRAGDRVLLCYPAGLDFLAAFFGCLYANVVAVPAYPPLNPRLSARLATVALDCDAMLALTTRATSHGMREQASLPAALADLEWLSTDAGLDGLEHAWRDPVALPEQVAFLQYTSGSSGLPKGVMVTHGNVLHNVHAINAQMQFGPSDHLFSWLPPYHDMGLVGAIMSPFGSGIPMTFMTPHAFLRRPLRWLREISERRCSVSGAPNFAFEMCIAKIGDEELGTLDLSSWSLAFSGAEPVKRDTLERFSARFARCGFQRRAFYPCYGMAETTLIVTGKPRERAFRTVDVDRDAYGAERRVIVLDDHDAAGRPSQTVVSCGTAAPGFKVVIVDPVRLAPCAEGEVGEIVVTGPSVAAGYWKRELETLATFGAHLLGHDGTFLRTGDLGFMHEGELFVSGRLKDVIIVRGVNHYPQDLESTVDDCHEAIRAGCGICFGVEHESDERVVFVQEIVRRDLERADEIMRAIRTAVLARNDVLLNAVVLVENGSINKTTSGKLSRRPCREEFLRDELRAIARWQQPDVERSVDRVEA
jgi:acyl-CoA synthetase (AMP-forming)/AMP-acid ligase II